MSVDSSEQLRLKSDLEFWRAIRNGALVTVAAAIVLRLMGQPWWCTCGTLTPWSWDIWSSHNSQHLLDPYSFTHLLHGVIFFWALKLVAPKLKGSHRFLIAVLIESAWEILENSPIIIDRYREVTISLDYYGDSVANSIFDIVSCALGYLLAKRIGWRWSLAVFCAVEIALLLTIRDCLTLNVIMLAYPIDAVKDWQMGAAGSTASLIKEGFLQISR